MIFYSYIWLYCIVSSRVRVGEYDLGREEDCDQYGDCAPPPQDFSPVEVVIHQQYNKPHKFQHDIAIIKLDRDVLENGKRRKL